MSEPQGSGGCAWLVFLAVTALICVIYPPFMGWVLGACLWIIPIAFITYVIGHRGPIL
jgi:hypothetical protein